VLKKVRHAAAHLTPRASMGAPIRIVSKPTVRVLVLFTLASLLAVACGSLSAAEGQNASDSEITTRETEPTFKVQVQRNMVLVRVVVRDSRGRPVTGLRREDFRLFDNGKPQVIAEFAVESPSSKPEKAAEPTVPEPDAEAVPETELAASAPRNYQALYFDDVRMSFDHIVRTRDAAERYLTSALQPGDRVGIFTSSGQTVLDFTDDRGKLHEVLSHLRPRPVVPTAIRACPEIDDYLAYMIVHRRDPYAIATAAEETFHCYYENTRGTREEPDARARAKTEAETFAVESLNLAETHINHTVRGLEGVVRRIAVLPGRRSVIFISPGFLSYTLSYQVSEIVDRALRSNVIVNTLDSKGLFVTLPYGDATRSPVLIPGRGDLMGMKQQYILDGVSHVQEVLGNLALGTGGEFFHNSNDLDSGFRRVGTLADVYYTLAFSPQNLKLDGSFHSLKVSLVKPTGLTVHARRGYYAPKKSPDPSAQGKEEIEQVVFSQDELNELPIDVHTQFFTLNDTEARLSVLTHLDLRLLRFRKEEGRNLDNLTFVTALFDRDGKFVTGREKLLTLRLRDATLDKLLQSGITLKTSFDLKRGTYLVRQVVRDAEGGQISGLNRTVEIPF